MKLVAYTGSNRVIDLIRPMLVQGNLLDVVTPAFSFFAFAEAQRDIDKIAQCCLLLPSAGGDLAVLGLDADRSMRNRLQNRWLVAWRKDLSPAGDSTCVFRDSAFADDVAKTNLDAILNQHGLSNVRSL